MQRVFKHTSLGYKGLNIDPFKRIENLLRNNNFPKDIFCTYQNTVFIYRYFAVASLRIILFSVFSKNVDSKTECPFQKMVAQDFPIPWGAIGLFELNNISFG